MTQEQAEATVALHKMWGRLMNEPPGATYGKLVIEAKRIEHDYLKAFGVSEIGPLPITR
jgi:hypothetical protein